MLSITSLCARKKEAKNQLADTSDTSNTSAFLKSRNAYGWKKLNLEWT